MHQPVQERDALDGLALGLGAPLSSAVPHAGERAPVHDRGKVLVHALLMLAGGGEACSDIEHLRAQPVLFGEVASDSTLYRTLSGLGPDVVKALLEAAAGVRAGVWERRGDMSGPDPVVLDIDSTLVEVTARLNGEVTATIGHNRFDKRMPFRDFDANAAWAQLVALSHALVRWFQQLRLSGPLANAAPKRLRWQLWHAPARLVRSSRKWTLRLLHWWPATPQLLHACRPGAP